MIVKIHGDPLALHFYQVDEHLREIFSLVVLSKKALVQHLQMLFGFLAVRNVADEGEAVLIAFKLKTARIDRDKNPPAVLDGGQVFEAYAVFIVQLLPVIYPCTERRSRIEVFIPRASKASSAESAESVSLKPPFFRMCSMSFMYWSKSSTIRMLMG